MFSIFLILFINLFTANSESIRQLREKFPQNLEVEKRFHLKWISDQTVFPFSFQLPHYDQDLVDYDWYKYDRDTYVTKLPNYKPNYFVSKQPYKTKLSIFNYDFQTHDQLTTYEPKRIFDFNDPAKPKHKDLYTLLLLQSHRIRIDRGLDHANVSCLADFLIDQNSMAESTVALMENIKNLAMFNLNVNDEMRKYYQERPGKQSWAKNHMLNYKKANQIGYGKQTKNLWYRPNANTIKLTRRRFRKQRSIFYYENNDLSSNLYDYESDYENKQGKSFYKVRLALGPIKIEEPFEQSLISCDLDLINADDVNLDHRSKVFKYLFKEDIGMDKDEFDMEDEDSFVIVSELSGSYTSTTVTTPSPFEYEDETTTNATQVASIFEELGTNETEITLNNFIPKTTVETLDETQETLDMVTEASTESQSQTIEKAKKPTLLFLLDHPDQNEASTSKSSSKSIYPNNFYFLYSLLIYVFLF